MVQAHMFCLASLQELPLPPTESTDMHNGWLIGASALFRGDGGSGVGGCTALKHLWAVKKYERGIKFNVGIDSNTTHN